jgi:hypothetical protein
MLVFAHLFVVLLCRWCLLIMEEKLTEALNWKDL